MIADFRRTVTKLLRDESSIPVYGFLPDDVAHLPCHVVGRPTIREGRQVAVMALTLTVSLLGRRISDEDSQAELDAYADELFVVLGGTRNVRADELLLRCVAFNPGTVQVAGLEMPAYLADVTIDHLTC